jgi:hypothetical protein
MRAAWDIWEYYSFVPCRWDTDTLAELSAEGWIPDTGSERIINTGSKRIYLKRKMRPDA